MARLDWVFRTFGEDDRKITKKAQTPEPAARAVCLRPYKTSEISNRLAGLRANEQYHQMCDRAAIWRNVSRLFGVYACRVLGARAISAQLMPGLAAFAGMAAFRRSTRA